MPAFIRIGDIQTFRRHPAGDDSCWRPVYFAGDRGSYEFRILIREFIEADHRKIGALSLDLGKDHRAQLGPGNTPNESRIILHGFDVHHVAARSIPQDHDVQPQTLAVKRGG